MKVLGVFLIALPIIILYSFLFQECGIKAVLQGFAIGLGFIGLTALGTYLLSKQGRHK